VPCARKVKLMLPTGIARHFYWEEPKIEKFCDVRLVTFFRT